MRKECKLFLLLGVMLFSIVLFGCTDPKETEADSVHVLRLSDLEGLCAVAYLESFHTSTIPRLNPDAGKVLFQEFFEGIRLTKDRERVSAVTDQLEYHESQVSFDCDCNLLICYYGEGDLCVYLGDEVYVSEDGQAVDWERMEKRIYELWRGQ